MKRPMLAGVADTVVFPVLVSPKIDGVRVTVWNGVAWSRSGRAIRNREVQRVAAEWPDGLDGELVWGLDRGEGVFARASSEMREGGSGNFTLWAFDLVGEDGFSSRYQRLVALGGLPQVKIVPHVLVQDQGRLDELERAALAEGYEGLMIRAVDGLHKEGRSTAREGGLLKLKRFVDDEARVLGCIEEMENCNEAVRGLNGIERGSGRDGLIGKGRLGALVCERDGVQFSIGTGFTAKDRETLWLSRETLPGLIVKYKHFPIGAKDAPRFPVFLGFRNEDDIG